MFKVAWVCDVETQRGKKIAEADARIIVAKYDNDLNPAGYPYPGFTVDVTV